MLVKFKSINSIAITIMLTFALLILFFSGFLDFPTASSLIPSAHTSLESSSNFESDPFKDLLGAYKKWDAQVGCGLFRQKNMKNGSNLRSIQDVDEVECSGLKRDFVGVLVKGWTWIPDNLDNLYSCRCGLSCLWTKSEVLVDKPDALLFETVTPPLQVLFLCSI